MQGVAVTVNLVRPGGQSWVNLTATTNQTGHYLVHVGMTLGAKDGNWTILVSAVGTGYTPGGAVSWFWVCRTVRLVAGWNLVGLPYQPEDPDVYKVLDSVVSCVAVVWAYNATDVADPWKNFNPLKPPFLNDLKQMHLGSGYWVYVTQNCNWYIGKPQG